MIQRYAMIHGQNKPMLDYTPSLASNAPPGGISFDEDGDSVRDSFTVSVADASQEWDSYEVSGLWWSATPSSGEGNTLVTIMCQPQELGEQPARSGKLVLRSYLCDNVEINITQQARV